MITEKTQRQLEQVRAKIDRAADAEEIARKAFDKLKQSPEWAAMCEQEGIDPNSNFGDWTC
jgi:hypothetical protein